MRPGISFVPDRREFNIFGLPGDIRIQNSPSLRHVSTVPFVADNTVDALEEHVLPVNLVGDALKTATPDHLLQCLGDTDRGRGKLQVNSLSKALRLVELRQEFVERFSLVEMECKSNRLWRCSVDPQRPPDVNISSCVQKQTGRSTVIRAGRYEHSSLHLEHLGD